MSVADGQKYLKFISYLQIIGIILVVLGHSFHQYPDENMGRSLWFYRLLYNVRMPMFTFVSGYLVYYTSFLPGRKVRSWKAFTLNKVKRLLIPYLTLTLVTFVPRSVMSSMADDPIEMSVSGFISSLVDSDHLVIPYFWFLHMSFILLVGSYLVLIVAKRHEIRFEIPLLALLLLFISLPYTNLHFTSIFAVREVVRLGMYFVLGIIYCRYSSVIDKYLYTGSLYTALISGAVWITLFFVFEGKDLSRVASIFGILMFVTICRILENKNIRVFDHLQGTNYIIFLLSWYVNVATQQVLSHFVVLPWWVHTGLSLIGGIYIPYLVFKLLQGHSKLRIVRVAAFLLGQNLSVRK